MSFTTLVVLTVLEIVLLVGVLAVFLMMITRGLNSISANLAKVAFGVRAVESQCVVIGPEVQKINRTLREAAGVLPGLVASAEQLERSA